MRLLSISLFAVVVASTSTSWATREPQRREHLQSLHFDSAEDMNRLALLPNDVLEVRITPWETMEEKDWSELRSELRPAGFEMFVFVEEPDSPAPSKLRSFMRDPVVLATTWGNSGARDATTIVAGLQASGVPAHAYPIGEESWAAIGPAALVEAGMKQLQSTRSSKNIAVREPIIPSEYGARFLVHDEVEFARTLPAMPSANIDPAAWCVLATAPGIMLAEHLEGARRAIHKCGCDPVGLATKEVVRGYFRVCLGGPTVPVFLSAGPEQERYDNAIYATLWSLRIPYGLELGGGTRVHVPKAYEAVAKAAVEDAQERFHDYLVRPR